MRCPKCGQPVETAAPEGWDLVHAIKFRQRWGGSAMLASLNTEGILEVHGYRVRGVQTLYGGVTEEVAEENLAEALWEDQVKGLHFSRCP